MDRRTFLVGSGDRGSRNGNRSSLCDNMSTRPWIKSAPRQPLAPGDIRVSPFQRLRKQFLAEFDAAVENVIVPHFLVSVYDGERPFLPMIGVELTKENALPYDLWGLLTTWKPAPEKGVTVFLQGLEQRGPASELGFRAPNSAGPARLGRLRKARGFRGGRRCHAPRAALRPRRRDHGRYGSSPRFSTTSWNSLTRSSPSPSPRA